MKNWLIIILFFLITVSIFWPVLFAGKVIINQFVLYHQYPALSFLGDYLSKYQSLPLWSDSFLNGFPLYLGQHNPVAPLSLFFRLADYLTVYNLVLFFSFSLGGLAMYALARNLNVSPWAAVISALTFVFSHLNIWLGSLIGFSSLLYLLPLLFLTVLKISQGKSSFIFFGAFLVLTGWLQAFSEFMIFSLAAVIAFALFLDFSRAGLFKNLLARFGTTGKVLLTMILGTILALPRLLVIYNFIDISARAEGAVGPTFFLGSGDIIGLLFPYFEVPFDKFVPMLSSNNFYLYFGILPLLVVAALFLNFKQAVKGRAVIWFFSALALVPLLVTVKWTGLFWLVRTATFDLFGGSWKLLFLSGFSLALLAGFGLDCLERVRSRLAFRRFCVFLKYCLAMILLLVIALSIGWLAFKSKVLNLADDYFVRHIYQETFNKPIDYYFPLIENSLARLFNNFSLLNYHFAVALFFVVVSVIIILSLQTGRISYPKFLQVAVLVVGLNFALVWQGFYRLAPRSIFVATPASAAFLKSLPENGFRIFRFWPGLSAYGNLGLRADDLVANLKLNKELLTPNLNVNYQLDSVDGDENFMSYRQSKIQAAIGSFRSPQNDGKNWLNSSLSLSAKLSRFQSAENRRLLSMMNIKYLLTSFEFDYPLKKVFETKITLADIPIYVYENPEVLPRIYFAEKVKFIEPDEPEVFQELLKVDDFRLTTLIECLKPECLYVRHQADPGDKIEIKEIKSGYLKLTTHTKHPRWLIYSESNLPTWEAKLLSNVQGLKTKALDLSPSSLSLPVYTANYLFQTVYLPPGENEVTFEYPGIWRQMGYAIENLTTQWHGN